MTPLGIEPGDVPACSSVLQPTAPPRAPYRIYIYVYIYIYNINNEALSVPSCWKLLRRTFYLIRSEKIVLCFKTLHIVLIIIIIICYYVYFQNLLPIFTAIMLNLSVTKNSNIHPAKIFYEC
jgi:hypothetical protein